MMDNIEAAYIAGFFDGEGMVVLGYGHRKHVKTDGTINHRWYPSCQMVLSSTNKDVLISIQRNLGVGRVYSSMSGPSKIVQRTVMLHALRIHKFTDVITVANWLIPFSRMKNEQLKIVKEALTELLKRKKYRSMKWSQGDLLQYNEFVSRLNAIKNKTRCGRYRKLERPNFVC